MNSSESKSKQSLQTESEKIKYIKRMVEQASERKYYGTLELKFQNGIPVSCRKIESFPIPD